MGSGADLKSETLLMMRRYVPMSYGLRTTLNSNATDTMKWPYFPKPFLPLDEAIASRAVFVIVSGSDGRADGRAETLLEPAK